MASSCWPKAYESPPPSRRKVRLSVKEKSIYGYTQKNWGTHSTTTSSKVLLVLPHTHETAGYSSFFGFFLFFYHESQWRANCLLYFEKNKKIIFIDIQLFLIWFMEIWRHFFVCVVAPEMMAISNHKEKKNWGQISLFFIVLLLFTVRDYLVAHVERGFLAKKNKQWNDGQCHLIFFF